MAGGAYGRLRSCDPPVTVPAWSCMLSGKDPGQLGFYGFRNRADHSYHHLTIASGASVKAERIWQMLARHGKRSIIVGVPQTWPVQPLNGVAVACFLTPPDAPYTYPRALAGELDTLLGERNAYMTDVRGFRTNDKAWLLDQIYVMTERRFKTLHYLLDREPWDFCMFVEMGVDRIHHGLWSTMDPAHPAHRPGNPLERAIHDYYVYVDREIGRLLERLDDDTAVLVVSDHGARAMAGGFCINEWLKAQGLLVLQDQPAGIAPLEKCEVDWSQTRVWGSGGYYARVFFNVEGREPQGVIPPGEYDDFRDEMVARFEATAGPDGQRLGTVARAPAQIYKEVTNIPPDLMVYFGNLAWRSVGSLGFDALYSAGNDTGPDDANHDWHGIFIGYDPRRSLAGSALQGLHIQQVAPTMLQLMGVPAPTGVAVSPIDLE